MSQPGVYVVVRDGSWSTVTINTGGYEIHQVTVLGLEVVLAFLSVYDTHHDVGTRLADEGALVDIDRRVLMVNSYQLDHPSRLVFLEALGRAWPGWEIRWAYHGLDDFAGYPALVDPPPDPVERWRYAAGQLPAGGDVPGRLTYDAGRQEMLTVDRGDGPIALAGFHDDFLALGPSVVDRAVVRPEPLVLDTHPSRGLHVDIGMRRAGMWTLDDYGAVARSWPDIWPGWTLDLWEDRASEQVSRARGALVLPAADLDAAREKFADRLDFFWLPGLREHRADPAYAAYYRAFDYNPWQLKPRFAVDLAEERYRDLRECALGERRSARSDRRWADNAAILAHAQQRHEALGWGALGSATEAT